MHADRPRAPTVLVVDDDFVVLDIVPRLFRQAGLTVLAASSGEAALTLLRDRGAEIDWLFTDINLPGIVDGCDVAGEYRDLYPTRPVIYASTRLREEQTTVPGSVFIEKPFRPEEIRRMAEMMHLAAGSVPSRAAAQSASARH